MKTLVEVKLDQSEIKKLCGEKIEEMLKTYDAESVFWDANELKRRTCMSWGTIQDTFFGHPSFPKKKVGQKWYFPARETRQFLEQWLNDQFG